ncbi:hypothetical protein Patl1_14995 [Pistacia atlantica]|uniref:Uncharacterized protein n=1 Tax=Pistacia atlantica TaxID=434234 RepID=A0ACC1B5Z5_9ROSI|nr:hypothetical protein Patl1_14995 [Pistacia atlantica]
MVFSNGSFFGHQQTQLAINFTDNIQSFTHPGDQTGVPGLGLAGDFNPDSRIRKPAHTVDSLVNFSPPDSANNESLSGRKRKRNSEKVAGETKRSYPCESKKRLRCLQDLVPGCYKTMGMAVMLDVIINYVRSLQNQIEFLSMKLSAASMYYDFNLELDATETMQGTYAYDAREMERMVREGYGGPSSFHSTWSL